MSITIRMGLLLGTAACSVEEAVPQPTSGPTVPEVPIPEPGEPTATERDTGLLDVGSTIALPLRVHIFRSEVEDLDANSVIDELQLVDFLIDVNRLFDDTGIQWTLESFSIELPRETRSWLKALNGYESAQSALRSLVRADTALSPNGFDLYVVRRLSEQGLGGAYLCPTAFDPTSGIFVPVEASSGDRQPTRKWAHELGHALSLNHTECTKANADRLMMFGACKYADTLRSDLTEDEIATMLDQAETGRPRSCD